MCSERVRIPEQVLRERVTTSGDWLDKLNSPFKEQHRNSSAISVKVISQFEIKANLACMTFQPPTVARIIPRNPSTLIVDAQGSF
jgi:hypothetical protein